MFKRPVPPVARMPALPPPVTPVIWLDMPPAPPTSTVVVPDAKMPAETPLIVVADELTVRHQIAHDLG